MTDQPTTWPGFLVVCDHDPETPHRLNGHTEVPTPDWGGKVCNNPWPARSDPIIDAIRESHEAEMQRKRDAGETVIVLVDGEIREEQP